MNKTELKTLGTVSAPSADIWDQRGSTAPQSLSAAPSLVNYIEPFFARKWAIIMTLLASLLLGWLTLLVWPRKYESEAKLLIKVGRESVSLDPTATTSETMMLQKTQEEEINSTLEFMRSRFITEKTVEVLGAGSVIDGILPGELGDTSSFQQTLAKIKSTASDALFKVLLVAGIKDDVSDRELAVMRLMKSVDIYSPKKSAVVIVNAKSKTPEMAQAIAKTTTDRFLEEYLKTSRTEGSQQFFEQQAAAAEQQLNGQLDRRASMLKKRDIASVESKRQALLSTLANIESSVRGRLNELELQEVALLAEYTTDHPKLSRLRRELADTRQTVETMQIEFQAPQSKVGELPVASRTPVLVPLSNISNASKGLIEKRMQVHADLRALMDFQMELDDVDREVTVAQGRLQKLRSKQEEARIIDELQSRRISNVTVIQPATFIERATSPKKKILAAGFAALGLMGGLGLVVLREIGATTLRSIHQLRAQAFGPLAVDLPRADRLLTRMHRESTRSSGAFLKKSTLRKQLKVVLSEAIALEYGNSQDGILVGVIAVSEGSGASSVATGLALLADEEGLETTLVDADSTGRTISKLFSFDDEKRLSKVAEGDAEIVDCVQRVADRTLKCLDATTPGKPIDKHDATSLAEWLRANNDLAVIDLPASSTSNKVFDLGMLNSVIVVLESNQTTTDETSRLLRRLQSKGTNVSALVLNKSRKSVPRWIERLLA